METYSILQYYISGIRLHPAAEVIREISDGAWFFLSLCLTLLFLWYSWRWLRRARWPYDRPTRSTIALAISFFGSTIRSGFLWLQWMSINNEWGLDFWKSTQNEIMVALLLCIVGDLMCIKLFLPGGYGWAAVFAVLLLSLGIPVFFHFVF